MLGRFCYSIIPLVFTAGCLALALVSFFGSFRTNTGALKNIYFMKLDFSNIEVSGFDVTSLVEQAGIHNLYQVGANGYCYGSLNGDSTQIDACKTPTTPFWFDLLSIFRDSQAGDLLDAINIPEELSDYENIVKKTSYAFWSLLIATCCLSFLVLVFGLFTFASKGLSCFVVFLAVLNLFAAVAAAGAATGLFSVYRNKFNDTADTFGATASLGRTALALIWAMAGCAVVGGLFWLFTLCFGSTSRKARSKDEDFESGHY